MNGRITALGKFIAKSAEKSLPLFKAFRKGKSFGWTSEYAEAFNDLKNYLGKPLLLSSPIASEILYVYHATSDCAVGAVLIREDDGVQRPVYYSSKALTDVESR